MKPQKGEIWEHYDYEDLRWRDFVICDVIPRGYKRKIYAGHDRRSELVIAIYIEDVSNTRRYFKMDRFKAFRKVETENQDGVHEDK